MSPAASRRWGRRSAWAVAQAGVAMVAAACVTTYEDTTFFGPNRSPLPQAVPVSIPFGIAGAGPDQHRLAELYGGILTRMQAAARDRDAAELQALLDTYERTDLPPELQQNLRGFRAVLAGLRFQQHAATRAKLALVPVTVGQPAPVGQPATVGQPAAERTSPSAPAGDAVVVVPPLGQSLEFELALPAPATPVLLGGRADRDPVCFALDIVIDDTYVDGSARSASSQDFVRLPMALELAGDTVLRLPIAVDAPSGEAVQRVVRLQVDLMLGYVQSAGVRAPIQRTNLGNLTVTQLPLGHEALAKAPLAALQAALRAFEPANFAAAYLAASFTRGADREAAQALLIEQVRFGRNDQAQVAMAALFAIADAKLPVGDRDAWLAWWQSRR